MRAWLDDLNATISYAPRLLSATILALIFLWLAARAAADPLSLGTGAVVNGNVLARTGAVTLLTNIVTNAGILPRGCRSPR